MNYEFTLKGEPLSPFNNSSKLAVVWHKVLQEIYCHSAVLDIINPPLNLFSRQCIKVQIETCVLRFDNGDEVDKICYKFWSFLPYTISANNTVRVPLNSESLINALSLDTWTKGGKLKEYPCKLSIYLDGQILTWDFDPYNNPHQLLLKHMDSLAEGGKMQVTINLDL